MGVVFSFILKVNFGDSFLSIPQDGHFNISPYLENNLESSKSTVNCVSNMSLYSLDPQYAHEFPMDYLERVKKMHQEGGHGSQG